MNTQFVPYDLALELKELGFDEPCLAFYERNKELIIQECLVSDFANSLQCVAPTFSQAFRWFREKGIESEIHSDFDRMLGYNRGYIPVVQFIEFYNNGDSYRTYEEAEQACLRKLIQIVKNK